MRRIRAAGCSGPIPLSRGARSRPYRRLKEERSRIRAVLHVPTYFLSKALFFFGCTYVQLLRHFFSAANYDSDNGGITRGWLISAGTILKRAQRNIALRALMLYHTTPEEDNKVFIRYLFST